MSKSFGGIQAVHSITFDVEAGASVGLVGPNGAGKTTLFNCVCGQLRPESGDIVFDGKQLWPAARPSSGHASASAAPTRGSRSSPTCRCATTSWWPSGRGAASAGCGGTCATSASPTRDEIDRVDAILELVGITHLADISVNALGLGNCRLVELARALATEPKILLADEPSSGLDLHETAEFAAVLRSVQRERGTAVLLVEHDLSMVAEVVDRTVVMDLGAMLAEGTFDEVMANPAVRDAYLGQMGMA